MNKVLLILTVTVLLLTANQSMPTNSVGFDGSGNFINLPYGVYEIRIAPSNTSVLYMVVTGQFGPSATNFTAVFVSTNRGATWAASTFPSSMNQSAIQNYRQNGQKLAIDPNNSAIAYLGTTDLGLWVTTNSGGSWTQISTGSVPASLTDGNSFHPPITGICFDPASGTTGGATNTIYAASFGNGVYQSTNAGSSWSLLSGSPQYVENAVVNGGNYYCCSKASSSGITISGQSTLLQKWNGSSWSTLLTDTGQFVHSVAIDPNNASNIVVGSGGDPTGYLNYSTNGGGAWTGWAFTQTFSDSTIGWFNNLASGTVLAGSNLIFDPSVSGKLWGSGGIGVFHTPTSAISGGSTAWVSQSVGIEQLVSTRIISPAGGSPIYSCWDRLEYQLPVSSYPSGYAFESTSNTPFKGWNIDYAQTSPSTIVAMNQTNGKSGYSTDKGATWQHFAAATFPPDGKDGGCIAASTASNFVRIGAGSTNAYYTTDTGATWNAATGLPTSGWQAAGNISDAMQFLCADGSVAGTFYAFNYINGIYKSTNNGAAWSNVSAEIFGGSGSAVQQPNFVSVPGQAGHLFGTLGFTNSAHPNTNPLRRSTDGGSTWSSVSNVKDIWLIGFSAIAPGQSYPAIYILGWVNSGGYKFGIWRSIDNCSTWTFLIDWPNGRVDQPTTLTGDGNTWNTCYIGYLGSGAVYGINL